jgi:anti-sigma factor RsiW
MNCSDWEERIALHAGGDLPPAETANVERHLRECAGCQVLASGLQQSLALLKEVHDEPLAPAHFSAVRARVMAELEQKRRPLWAWAWSFGLAAATVALLVMLALRPGRTPEHRAPAVAVNHPPVVTASEPVVPPPPHRRVRRRVVVPPIVPDTPTPEPLIVKLQTDDPNVVIYWIADRKRGE